MPTPVKRIFYIQYTNPAAYPPLEHSSQILANLGWQVNFFGILRIESDSQRIVLAPHENIRTHYVNGVSAGMLQRIHFIGYILWVLLWIIRLRPNYMYISDPFNAPIGLILRMLTRIPTLYHEHDSPENYNTPQLLKSYERILAFSRQHIAQQVVLNILPNEKRAKVFQQDTKTSRPVVTVWNCPSRKEVLPARQPSQKDNPLVIWYHGSIGAFRLPISIVSAVGKLKGIVRLLFAGYETIGSQGYIQQMYTEAQALHCRDSIEYLGVIPARSELLQRCQSADVGVTFSSKGQSENTSDDTFWGASNKPFDYMACGLALIGAKAPIFDAIYVQPGYGLSCDPDDVDSIVETFQWFYDHRKETHAMGEAGRQRILTEWNYEQTFQPVVDYLNAT